MAQLSDDFSKQIGELEGVIHGLAGGPFTIGSPKQLGDVLFERMGLKGGRKGKSGVYSTDVNEMERLAADKDSPGAEIAARVLDWRQLTKLKNTYTDALQEQINPATGRVHTSYSLTGAAGRRTTTRNGGPVRDRRRVLPSRSVPRGPASAPRGPSQLLASWDIGSTGAPPLRISKCSCGEVTLPDAPDLAMVWPRFTFSPGRTSISPLWA